MPKWILSLLYLPSVDFHWWVPFWDPPILAGPSCPLFCLWVHFSCHRWTVPVTYSSAIVRIGFDHLCCFTCWLPTDLPYFTFCTYMPSFRCSSVRPLASWTVPFFCLVCAWAASWLWDAIPMVGVNVCAALKHTLPVVGFYFIHSFLATGCLADSAARILEILACSWNLACTF
jgi:hypothetical protein